MACKQCQKKETAAEHWAKRGIKPKPPVKTEEIEKSEEHSKEECKGCSEDK